ncbi:hypothetical protein LV779_09130 [Streptomyces thinghirensis]|nr:hypothetical protein [Streptomyces thinghirensis]
MDATAWRLRIHGEGVTRRRPDLRRPAAPRADRAGHHPDLRVQRGRWPASSATPAGSASTLDDLLKEAASGPRPAGGPADQLVARSVDGMTIGSPVEEVMDGRDAMLAVVRTAGCCRSTTASRPHARPRPVRLRVRLQVDRGHRADHVRRVRLLPGQARLGPRGPDQDPVPDRHPEAVRPAEGGHGDGGRRRLGPAPAASTKIEVRVDDGPWQGATLAAEDSRDTWRQWSYALAGRQGRPHPHRAGDRPHRRGADREAHPHRS